MNPIERKVCEFIQNSMQSYHRCTLSFLKQNLQFVTEGLISGMCDSGYLVQRYIDGEEYYMLGEQGRQELMW